MEGTDYQCTCNATGGYSGNNCESRCSVFALFIMLLSYADHQTKAVFFLATDRDACNSNPCANGGTCSKNATGYQCIGKPGYMGNNCEGGCSMITVCD